MRHVYKLFIVVALAVFFFARPVSVVGAQGTQDFVITSFDASYELSNEDKQGLLKTTEKIALNFSGQNHRHTSSDTISVSKMPKPNQMCCQ